MYILVRLQNSYSTYLLMHTFIDLDKAHTHILDMGRSESSYVG